jgi:hypothetical protein
MLSEASAQKLLPLESSDLPLVVVLPEQAQAQLTPTKPQLWAPLTMTSVEQGSPSRKRKWAGVSSAPFMCAFEVLHNALLSM